MVKVMNKLAPEAWGFFGKAGSESAAHARH